MAGFDDSGMTQEIKACKKILEDEIIRLATNEVAYHSETDESLFHKIKHLARAHEDMSAIVRHLDEASW
jgi:hypothetical protein